MTYKSTRDGNVRVTASQAIVQGISAEGGLFVPEYFPSLASADWDKLMAGDYAARAAFVLSRYLTDFTAEEIEECTRLAYGNNFRHPDIAPLHELAQGVHILELWHGPTCAFKDMALQILPHLMRFSVRRMADARRMADVRHSTDGKTLIILVATSGDTGKAALEGFRDAENTRILVFYPENGVSPMQKLQMVTQEGGNVAVCGIRGNFDDAQTGVKAIFTDPAVSVRLAMQNMQFSSANSINWGRLVPQIVYYISAYCDLLKKGKMKAGQPVNVVVPTGNFGNILAAYYARKMGLPVARLICASNRNNVLTDFIQTGVYDRNRPFYPTASPSMDILISSNLERLLYDLSGNDEEEIRRLMTNLKDKGRYEVSARMAADIRSLFSAGWCDDTQTAQAIQRVFKEHGYLCDTHTAVGIHVYEQYRKQTGDSTPALIASTANPYKFPASVLDALGGSSPPEEFEKMQALFEATGLEIPEPLTSIGGKPIRFTDICNPADMEQTVYRLLHIGE